MLPRPSLAEAWMCMAMLIGRRPAAAPAAPAAAAPAAVGAAHGTTATPAVAPAVHFSRSRRLLVTGSCVMSESIRGV